jgi:hypothetical protein
LNHEGHEEHEEEQLERRATRTKSNWNEEQLEEATGRRATGRRSTTEEEQWKGSSRECLNKSQIRRHSRESGNPFCFNFNSEHQDGFPLSRE